MQRVFFCGEGGSEEDLRGTKHAKIAPNFGTLFGGQFLLYNWAKNETLAKFSGSRSV